MAHPATELVACRHERGSITGSIHTRLERIKWHADPKVDSLLQPLALITHVACTLVVDGLGAQTASAQTHVTVSLKQSD